jgi:hypothetical protein
MKDLLKRGKKVEEVEVPLSCGCEEIVFYTARARFKPGVN